jgi:hypothetical protein
LVSQDFIAIDFYLRIIYFDLFPSWVSFYQIDY